MTIKSALAGLASLDLLTCQDSHYRVKKGSSHDHGLQLEYPGGRGWARRVRLDLVGVVELQAAQVTSQQAAWQQPGRGGQAS